MIVELKPFGQFWQVTRDGSVLACAVERHAALNCAAALLRRQLNDPDEVVGMKFVGLDLAELLAAKPNDPNWKRKGPRIEVELFEQVEVYLELELPPTGDEELTTQYRSALRDEDFDQALECLLQLGERQGCTNPFWRVLERLAEALWPTQWMVDRRAKGQREAKIAAIKQRARGRC